MRKRRIIEWAAAISLTAAALVAITSRDAGAVSAADSIMVMEPIARATPGAARNGAAYMMLHNMGEADKLIAAQTPVAGRVELHIHSMDGGIARMRKAACFTLPAGEGLNLAPGGLALMLMDLKAPLKEGTEIPLTLTFAKAGTLEVDVPVKSIAEGAAAEDHSAHMAAAAAADCTP